MPAGHEPIRPHPGKPFRTLRDAADARQVITLRCNLCHERVSYLAEDLILVFGPDRPAHHVPFPCSRCRTAEYINLTIEVPRPETYMKLVVRRPVKQVQRWIWRNEKLG